MPDRLEIRDLNGRMLRSTAMTRDPADPTKWHLEEPVSIGRMEMAFARVDGEWRRLEDRPTTVPINTLFLAEKHDGPL